MIVAFDLDGSLQAQPDVLRRFIETLRKADCTICVLASSTQTHPSREQRVEQLNGLGISQDMYDDLYIVRATEGRGRELGKAEYCHARGVDIAIVCDQKYATAIRHFSPGTVCLLLGADR